MNGKTMAETKVPMRMYGILFPIGVWVLSESLPKIGRRIRAARLSAAMIIPTIHWTLRILWLSPESLSSAEEMPYILLANISVRKVGHHESYTCHRSRIPKKAKPMRSVLFTFNFSWIGEDDIFFSFSSFDYIV